MLANFQCSVWWNCWSSKNSSDVDVVKIPISIVFIVLNTKNERWNFKIQRFFLKKWNGKCWKRWKNFKIVKKHWKAVRVVWRSARALFVLVLFEKERIKMNCFTFLFRIVKWWTYKSTKVIYPKAKVIEMIRMKWKNRTPLQQKRKIFWKMGRNQ